MSCRKKKEKKKSRLNLQIFTYGEGFFWLELHSAPISAANTALILQAMHSWGPRQVP